MNNPEILLQEFNSDISNVNNSSDLQKLEIKYLGRNGLVNKLFQEIKDLNGEEKKEFGNKINSLKKEIEEKLFDKKILLIRLLKYLHLS